MCVLHSCCGGGGGFRHFNVHAFLPNKNETSHFVLDLVCRSYCSTTIFSANLTLQNCTSERGILQKDWWLHSKQPFPVVPNPLGQFSKISIKQCAESSSNLFWKFKFSQLDEHLEGPNFELKIPGLFIWYLLDLPTVWTYLSKYRGFL